MSEDLKKLFPVVDIVVAGEPVKVHPFYFGQVSRVAKLCKPIAEVLLSSGLMVMTTDEKNVTTVKMSKDAIPKLFIIMAESSEPLLSLIAFASDKPREWLDEVPIDEGVKLAQTVWEVNANFFVERVLPILGPKLSSFVSIGETSSPASSGTAIEGQT